MFTKLFSGIFGHFLLRASIIQLISSLLLLAFVLPFFNRTANELAAEQGQTLANSMLAASSDAVYSQNYSIIVEYCLNVIKATPNIHAITYSKRNGEEIVVSGKQWSINNKTLPYYQLKFEDPVKGNIPHRYALEYKGYGLVFTDIFNYSQPIFIGGKDWGVLTISFSTKAYSSSIRNFYSIVIYFTLAAFLLSFTLFLISSRRIRRQINSFKYVAKSLADGNFTLKAQESAIGEIGILGQAINNMSDSLQEKSSRISQLVKIVEQTNDGFVLFDDAQRVVFTNDALERWTGYPPSHFEGMALYTFIQSFNLNPSELLHELDLAVINNIAPSAHDVVYQKNNLHSTNLAVTLEAILDNQGYVQNILVVIANIDERKAAEAEIRSLAFYDPLTGLPNRRLLADRLKRALVSTARTGKNGTLLFLDLDNFKILNDTLGHDVGDLLLQQVATRLTTCLREGDTIARLGGDEFIMILENLSESGLDAVAQTEAVGEKILKLLNQPYLLASNAYQCTPSIGATLFNDQNTGIDELLKQADIAMYQAKAAGRNTLRFFNSMMQEAISARVTLEKDLKLAIEKNQFVLYYQLQISHSHQITGVESLIRWLHPERGLISPIEFIPLAEETGLILPIGCWLLESACAQLKQWENQADTSHLQIAVNVSARQFQQTDFVTEVCKVMQKHTINPKKLKLELTESLVINDIQDVIKKMNQLREFGVSFSMDDFGTGYSSLSYLAQLPMNELKIDKSFVRNIGIKSSDSAIIKTIISMASYLDISVIAEGVETEEQRAFLEQNGCSLCQGYLFGKPVPVGEFEIKLRENVALK